MLTAGEIVGLSNPTRKCADKRRIRERRKDDEGITYVVAGDADK
jgi:hypothetical protein